MSKLTSLAAMIAVCGSAASASTVFTNAASYTGQYDFAVGGSATRTTLTNSGDPLQPSVVNVPLTSIPGSATVVKAYIVWNYLTNSPGAAAEKTISVNGNAVSSLSDQADTPDTGWGRTHVSTYRADITSLVTGNGIYQIGGAGDQSTGALGEGVSILAVYSDSSLPTQTVDVFWGLSNNQNPLTAEAILPFSNAYLGGPTHFFCNQLDGQSYSGDDFIVNGIVASGSLGTGPAGNAWNGLLGVGAANNLYDHAEGDASPFMTMGDTMMLLESPGVDFLDPTVAAISYRVVPVPSTLAVCVAGGLWARRRRMPAGE